MRLSRVRAKLCLRGTICVHITHAARVDTSQPGIAKRVGLACFG